MAVVITENSPEMIEGQSETAFSQRHDVPVSEPTAPNRGPESMEDAVARRAYELYRARGAQDGHDLDDWLGAERELRSERHATTAA